jgi:carboxymethylenebutenolidase
VTVLVLAAVSCIAAAADREASFRSETVVVHSGTLKLRAALWRPRGPGPFPAVLFNHGRGRPIGTPAGQQDQRNRVREPTILGPAFAGHGYVFLYLFRRGAGLSAGEGTAGGDLMDKEVRRHGQEGRNRIQLELLEIDEMSDAIAGLEFLRAHPEVDPRRGHRFVYLSVATWEPDVFAFLDEHLR